VAAKVEDIIAVMEKIAPADLAEEWDNAGLQLGERDWPVRNIWLALEPAPGVVAAVCKKGGDLLITHHPLIFEPLKSIDTGTSTGKIIGMALQQQLAIYAAHTNLDSAAGGLNEALAKRIGLRSLRTLGRGQADASCKLVVFVPPSDEQNVLAALFETPAGRIGAYSDCSFRVRGKGTFRPGPAARPAIGHRGRLSEVDEVRIEAVVPRKDVRAAIERVRACHPYETMAYDAYPLEPAAEDAQGLGRLGELEKPATLLAFAEKVKKVLAAGSIRVVGNRKAGIRRVAVCTGSGSGMIDTFLRSGADVFVSGDLRYHDARAVEAAGRALIDVGHFASERIVVDLLSKRLRPLLIEKGFDVKINVSKVEKDPFAVV